MGIGFRAMAFGAVNHLTSDKDGNDDRIGDLFAYEAFTSLWGGHLQLYGTADMDQRAV